MSVYEGYICVAGVFMFTARRINGEKYTCKELIEININKNDQYQHH